MMNNEQTTTQVNFDFLRSLLANKELLELFYEDWKQDPELKIEECPVCYRDIGITDKKICTNGNHTACCRECFKKLRTPTCPLCRDQLEYDSDDEHPTTLGEAVRHYNNHPDRVEAVGNFKVLIYFNSTESQYYRLVRVTPSKRFRYFQRISPTLRTTENIWGDYLDEDVLRQNHYNRDETVRVNRVSFETDFDLCYY